MQDDKTSAVPDETPETPELARPVSRTEKLFVRVSVWQTVLSVAGVFIGVVALYGALTESEAGRKQTAATVWPYLQLEISDYANETGAGFSIAFSNAGTGGGVSGLRGGSLPRLKPRNGACHNRA